VERLFKQTFAKLSSISLLAIPAETRVARWYVFKPKIQLWVNSGGPRNEKGWYIIWPFGIYYGHLVYVMAIW
jgi:hypothetical protein